MGGLQFPPGPIGGKHDTRQHAPVFPGLPRSLLIRAQQDSLLVASVKVSSKISVQMLSESPAELMHVLYCLVPCFPTHTI